MVLLHPNPRQTKLLSIQIGPTALGEPSSPSPAWCNGSWWLYHISYFMEVMQEVGVGLRLDLLGAFLLEKKKENVQESNLLHTTCFFSAVSVFPRGFPTKVSKPLVFGRPHQWAQRHCSCWTILLVAGKQQSLDIGTPPPLFSLGGLCFPLPHLPAILGG